MSKERYVCEIHIKGNSKVEVMKHLLTIQKDLLDNHKSSYTEGKSFTIKKEAKQ